MGTSEPDYYRWTQWIFLKLYERGLAYRHEAAVQWCPKDQTVLANEQVIDGRCERCGTPVESRKLEQWFFKITDYAERLLEDFLDARGLARARDHDAAQTGSGARREPRSSSAPTTPRSTSRSSPPLPDTLFGATFFVLAPEHPTSSRLVAGDRGEGPVREYIDEAMRTTIEERGAEDRDKTGVPLGRESSIR